MPWFAAHAVLYLKCLDGAQDTYITWENVYLIEAPERALAFDAAAKRALAEAWLPDDPGLFGGVTDVSCWGRPARWVFAGVRKVVDVCVLSADDVLASGDELTYNQLSFSKEADILDFADGRDLQVHHDDRLFEPEGNPIC